MISQGDRLAPALLDINVLFALAWPTHVHHERAHRWFSEVGALAWATCPVTQSGFVRLSSNPAVAGVTRTPRQAIELLRSILALPGHVFWHDDVAISQPDPIEPERIVGHRQVTDAHLLALAIRRGGYLATFDRRVDELVPDRRGSVALIP